MRPFKPQIYGMEVLEQTFFRDCLEPALTLISTGSVHNTDLMALGALGTQVTLEQLVNMGIGAPRPDFQQQARLALTSQERAADGSFRLQKGLAYISFLGPNDILQ